MSPVASRAGAWAAAVLLPAVAAAAPSLVVMGPVTEARPALVRELRQAVCAAVECVPWGTVSDGERVDLDRVRAAGIDGVLSGAVEARGPRRFLALELLAPSAVRIGEWRIGLGPDGLVARSALEALARDLERRLAAPASAGEPSAPLPPARGDVPAQRGEPAPGPRPPWLALEVSASVARTELSFQGASPSPGPLRGQRVPALLAPGLRVELQPAAWWTDGALAGLSLQGAWAAAAGVETVAGATTARTRVTELSAGIAWRSAPPAGTRRSVAAGVSWERRDATATPSIPGLPDRRLQGVKASGGVAQPLGRASLFAAAGLVRWLDAPDLVAGRRRFFPGGSAWGIDAELGVRVRLVGPWSLQLAAEYSTTRYRLDRDPGGIYAARSARDERLASRLAVRVDL